MSSMTSTTATPAGSSPASSSCSSGWGRTTAPPSGECGPHEPSPPPPPHRQPRWCRPDGGRLHRHHCHLNMGRQAPLRTAALALHHARPYERLPWLPRFRVLVARRPPHQSPRQRPPVDRRRLPPPPALPPP